MIDKGKTQSISFSKEQLDLFEYIHQIANNKHGGNVSLAVLDCIRCHKLATRIYGNDWMQMENPPGWANDILTKSS